jgi:hypothetical protein
MRGKEYAEKLKLKLKGSAKTPFLFFFALKKYYE